MSEQLMFNDAYFMQQALREAQKALEQNEVPIGAVVVIDNKIISRGYNQTEMLRDCTAHAEMIALTAAFNQLGSKYLPQASLYVTVEPCLMCGGALYWSKIGKVVFGCRDEKNGYNRYFEPDQAQVSSKPFHPKTRLVYGVLEQECRALMQNFFRTKRG